MKRIGLKQSISLLLSIMLLIYHPGTVLLVVAAAEEAAIPMVASIVDTSVVPDAASSSEIPPQPAAKPDIIDLGQGGTQEITRDLSSTPDRYPASGAIPIGDHFPMALTGVPMEELQMQRVSLTLPYLAEQQLAVADENGAALNPLDVLWSSDDATVAQVDNLGRISAVGAGTATVTAALGGISTVCNVTVTPIVVDLDYSDLKALDKFYDGTTTAQITGQLKLKHSAAEVSFAQIGILEGHFASKNASRNLIDVSISAAGYTLDNPNYTMPSTIDYKLKAYINTVLLSLQVPDFEIPYGGSIPDYTPYMKIGVLGEIPLGEWQIAYSIKGLESDVVDAGVYDVEISFQCTDTNYVRQTYISMSKLTVSPTLVELTGLSVKSKVYDGTLEALIEGSPAPSKPFVGDVYISGTPVGVFASADAGQSKEVHVSGLQLKGKGAVNYTLSPIELQGEITKRPLELIYHGSLQKVYDKSNRMKLDLDQITLLGILPQDQGQTELTEAEAILEDIYPASSVRVSGVDARWQEGDRGNYALSLRELYASITPASLNVTDLAAVDRVYDGTTTVQLSGGRLVGVYAGDQVVLTGSGVGSIPSKNAASQQVTVSGLSLGGTDSACYVLQPISDISVKITPKPLMLSDVIIADKVYDGSLDAIVQSATLSAPLSGDELRLDLPKVKAEFLDANAGANKAVKIYPNQGLDGRDSDNYALTFDENAICGRILKASPTLSLQAGSFVYDGEAKLLNCTIGNVNNPLALADQLSYSYLKQGESVPSTQAPVDAGVYEVSAHLAETSNYYGVSSPVALLTIAKADITAVELRHKEFVYDGSAKSLELQGALPSGTAVQYQGNEQVAVGDHTVTAVIIGKNHNPRTLTATLGILRDTPVVKLHLDKTYALQDEIITIDIELFNSQTGRYEPKLPESVSLLINGSPAAALQGKDGKYRYQYTAPSMQGTVSFQATTAENAYYFESASPLGEVSISNKLPSLITMQVDRSQITYGEELGIAIGLKVGDKAAAGKIALYHHDVYIKTVDLDSKGSYHYKLDKDVLQAGTLRVRAVYEDGAEVTASEALVDINIAPKRLGLSATAMDKTYDGTAAADVKLVLSGVISPDQITATGSAAFVSSAAGEDKSVTVSGIVLIGSAAKNYIVDTTATATASIHKKLLTARLTPKDKVYDGSDQAELITELIGVVADETVTAYTTGHFADAMAGSDKMIEIIGMELVGVTAVNYDVKIDTLPKASILPRELKFTQREIVLYYSGFGQWVEVAADVKGVELTYKYHKDGVEISPPIVSAGEYIVTVAPKSSNYSGSAEVKVKVLSEMRASLDALPQSGTVLSGPVAVLGGEIGYIDPDNGHFINREDYANIEPMLQITEPDEAEYVKLQDAMGLLGEYEQVGFISLSFMLRLDDKDGSSTHKTVSLDQTIVVCLPYPAGLGMKDYSYKLLHIGSNGPELMELTPKEGWLEFRSGDFSPFALAYSKKPVVVDPTDPTDPPEKPSTSYSRVESNEKTIDWQAVYRELMQTNQPVVINCSGLTQIPAYVIDCLRDTDRVLSLLYQGETIQIGGRYLPAYEAERVYYPLELLCQKYGIGLTAAEIDKPTITPISIHSPAAEPYRPKLSYRQEDGTAVYRQAKEVIATVGETVQSGNLAFVAGIISGALFTVAAVFGIRIAAKKKV